MCDKRPLLCYLLIYVVIHCTAAAGVHDMFCSEESSNPRTSPILCPKTHEPFPKYTCSRFVTNATNGGLTLESSELLVEKNNWSGRFRHFNRHLHKSGAWLTMVGDSLTGIMSNQYQCLEEFADVSQDESRFFKLNTTGPPNPFLAKLPTNYTSRSPLRYTVSDSSVEWFDLLRSFEAKKKYIVVNIGAWLASVRRIDEKKVNYVEVFKEHFAPHSPLIKMIRTLIREDNITVIWRDSSPAGMCGVQTSWSYYDLFPEFNAIARRALAAEGALILDIWKDTLPYWDQHMGSDDQLHFCGFQMESPPNVWIRKLMDLIMRDQSRMRWSADSGHYVPTRR